MAQLDALNLVESLRKRLVDFVVDGSFTRDPNLARIARMLWSEAPDKGGLLSELWIEANFPAAQSTWTLDRLTQAGRFNFQLCRQLNRTGGIPQHRPLYSSPKSFKS